MPKGRGVPLEDMEAQEWLGKPCQYDYEHIWKTYGDIEELLEALTKSLPALPHARARGALSVAVSLPVSL